MRTIEYYLINDVGLNWSELRETKDITYRERYREGIIGWLLDIVPWWDNEPRIETEVTVSESITMPEVNEYLGIHNAVQEIKEEKREKARKRAERKQS